MRAERAAPAASARQPGHHCTRRAASIRRPAAGALRQPVRTTHGLHAAQALRQARPAGAHHRRAAAQPAGVPAVL